MTSRVWNGGSGDWADGAGWTAGNGGASGAPQPGDAAAIPVGNVTIHGSEGRNGYLYEGVALTLGDATDGSTTLNLSNAYLGSFFSISAAGSTTIASQGASAVAGTVTDKVSGSVLTLSGDASNPNGLLLVNGASVSVSSGATLRLSGLVTDEGNAKVDLLSGSTLENDGEFRIVNATADVGGALRGGGTIDLEDGSTLEVDGEVTAGQTIAFTGLGAELHVEDPQDFAGSVQDFRTGDRIDFTGLDAAQATAASYDAGTRTLSLTAASGATLVQLHGVQAAAGQLSVTPDQNGTGVTVGYAGALSPASYTISDGDRAMRSDVVRSTMTVPGTTTPLTGAGVRSASSRPASTPTGELTWPPSRASCRRTAGNRP